MVQDPTSQDAEVQGDEMHVKKTKKKEVYEIYPMGNEHNSDSLLQEMAMAGLQEDNALDKTGAAG